MNQKSNNRLLIVALATFAITLTTVQAMDQHDASAKTRVLTVQDAGEQERAKQFFLTNFPHIVQRLAMEDNHLEEELGKLDARTDINESDDTVDVLKVRDDIVTLMEYYKKTLLNENSLPFETSFLQRDLVEKYLIKKESNNKTLPIKIARERVANILSCVIYKIILHFARIGNCLEFFEIALTPQIKDGIENTIDQRHQQVPAQEPESFASAKEQWRKWLKLFVKPDAIFSQEISDLIIQIECIVDTYQLRLTNVCKNEICQFRMFSPDERGSSNLTLINLFSLRSCLYHSLFAFTKAKKLFNEETREKVLTMLPRKSYNGLSNFRFTNISTKLEQWINVFDYTHPIECVKVHKSFVWKAHELC